jgi:hypothetical protein
MGVTVRVTMGEAILFLTIAKFPEKSKQEQLLLPKEY